MRTPDRPARGGATQETAGVRRAGVLRNSAHAFAFQLLGAALAAATTIFLARALGPTDFGTFALALSVGALLILPADLGISPSAQRFLAEHAHQRQAVAAVLGDGYRLKFLITLPVAVALAVAAGPIADGYDNPALAWPLRAAALALFFESFTLLSTGAFAALGRVAYNVRLLPLTAVGLGLTVLFVLEGGGPASALTARAISLALVAVVGAYLLWRLVGRPRPRLRGGSAAGRRRIAAYAGPVVLVDSAFAVFSQLDVLLIGTLLGASEAGLFQAPLRAVTFLHYPGYAIAAAVAPRLAHHDRPVDVARLFAGGLRVTVLIQAGLAAALVAWAEPIVLLLLGPEYEESVDVLRAFAPFVLLSGVAPLVGLGANYLGEAGKRLPIAIGAVAINLVIDLALLRELGIIAGVIGSTAAYLLYVPAHLRICRRRVGFPLRPLAFTLARALVAGAAAAGVLALIGTGELSALEWIAGAILGPLTYGAALVLLREVRPGELNALRSRVRALIAERG